MGQSYSFKMPVTDKLVSCFWPTLRMSLLALLMMVIISIPLDMRDSGQYDLLIWNVLVANTGDPENYLRENWYSSSSNNTAGYNNPDVDKLLDELAQTFDEDARKDLIIDIQQDIMDDAATVFFGYETKERLWES